MKYCTEIKTFCMCSVRLDRLFAVTHEKCTERCFVQCSNFCEQFQSPSLFGSEQAIESFFCSQNIQQEKKIIPSTNTMIDTSKIPFTPRLLKRRIFKKEKSKSRWEAESPPTRPRRRVSFSGIESVRSTISRNDFSIEEKDNAWYNSDELLTIKIDNNRIIRNIRAGQYEIDSLDSEARGLEHKTRTRMHQREKIITDALLAVLEEQDLQEELFGVVMDTKQIAKTYGRICKPSQLEAVKRAEIDAGLVHGECKNKIEPPSSSGRTKRRRSWGNVFDVLKTERSSTTMDSINFRSLVLIK